jgi:hypothetical protein
LAGGERERDQHDADGQCELFETTHECPFAVSKQAHPGQLGRNRHRVTVGERTYFVLTDQQVGSRECQAVMNGGQQWPSARSLNPAGTAAGATFARLCPSIGFGH